MPPGPGQDRRTWDPLQWWKQNGPGFPWNYYQTYLGHRTAIEQALNQDCVDADRKQLLLRNAKAEIEWLLRYAKSYARDKGEKAEVDSYAFILTDKYTQLEKKRECTPAGAPQTPEVHAKPHSPSIEELRNDYGLPKCLTEAEVERFVKLAGEYNDVLADLAVLKQAKKYIESGQSLSDFVRTFFEIDTSKPGELKLQRRFETEIGHDANRIHANPHIIEEKEQQIQEMYDEMEGLKNKKCPGDKIGMLGPHLGFDVHETYGCLGTTEQFADDGAISNIFRDCKDPLGAGLLAGYNFAPWNNSVRIGGFVSLDYQPMTINHTFPAGTYLGTTSHWAVTAGIKVGGVTSSGVFVYGLTGVAFLNQDLNINFGGPVTSANVTTPGATLGLGGEYQPAFLNGFGLPITLFAQFQHTIWQDSRLTMPAASPLFNYTFRRNDDAIKFGLNVYFGR